MVKLSVCMYSIYIDMHEQYAVYIYEYLLPQVEPSEANFSKSAKID